MVKIHNGDIFEAPIDVLVHQANCFHTFGSGIARIIRARFPEAYKADCQTEKGDMTKLGTYSVASLHPFGQPARSAIKLIFNMYSQHGFSDGNRATSYDAMVTALTAIEKRMRGAQIGPEARYPVVGVPYKIGCGLGGGDYRIVEAILHAIFDDSPVTLLICQRPGDV